MLDYSRALSRGLGSIVSVWCFERMIYGRLKIGSPYEKLGSSSRVGGGKPRYLITGSGMVELSDAQGDCVVMI